MKIRRLLIAASVIVGIVSSMSLTYADEATSVAAELSAPSEDANSADVDAEKIEHIRSLPAGTGVSDGVLEEYGIDNYFYVEEIDDATFERMWNKSYKDYCTVPREELRYIRCLYKDIKGHTKVGELVMNVAVADTVCEIFRKLYDASFPIENMRLVDEYDADDELSIMHDNTSAFNFRTVAGTNEISKHAYGLAIDINPYYNVYYIPSENYIFPEDGWEYLDRERDFPYKVEPGDLCYELFTEAGFEWGGWWTYNTDYQHFQYPLY